MDGDCKMALAFITGKSKSIKQSIKQRKIFFISLSFEIIRIVTSEDEQLFFSSFHFLKAKCFLQTFKRSLSLDLKARAKLAVTWKVNAREILRSIPNLRFDLSY